MNYVRLEGEDRLIDALKKALVNHKPDEVRKVCRRAAMIIVNEAKLKVQHDVTGTLRRSIKILPKFSRDPFGTFVGPRIKRKRKAKEFSKIVDSPFYAAWVEYGTAAHNLGYKGKYVSGKGADHPGSRPKPFMRPAYDSKGQEALRVAMDDIEKMILNNVR